MELELSWAQLQPIGSPSLQNGCEKKLCSGSFGDFSLAQVMMRANIWRCWRAADCDRRPTLERLIFAIVREFLLKMAQTVSGAHFNFSHAHTRTKTGQEKCKLRHTLANSHTLILMQPLRPKCN